MGNVGSRLDDSGGLFFKDQSRCMFILYILHVWDALERKYADLFSYRVECLDHQLEKSGVVEPHPEFFSRCQIFGQA